MGPGFFNWLYTGVFAALHPFFISMVDINYNAPARSVEVSVRIFTDDFEKNLRKNCGCKVELVRPADKAAMNNIISNYIGKHLHINIDGKPAPLQFNGFEQEDASTWNYFEIKNINSVKKIDVNTDIMFDFSEQQINMLHVKVGNNEKNDKLEFPDQQMSFAF